MPDIIWSTERLDVNRVYTGAYQNGVWHPTVRLQVLAPATEADWVAYLLDHDAPPDSIAAERAIVTALRAYYYYRVSID